MQGYRQARGRAGASQPEETERRRREKNNTTTKH